MKDFLQGDADRRIVGIGVHDVRHARPPFFDDFRLREAVGGIVIAKFLRGQFRPNFVMPFLIFFFTSRMQFHGERISQHGFFPFARRRQGQCGALLPRGYGMTRNIIFLIADYHVNVNLIESFLPVKKNM